MKALMVNVHQLVEDGININKQLFDQLSQQYDVTFGH